MDVLQTETLAKAAAYVHHRAAGDRQLTSWPPSWKYMTSCQKIRLVNRCVFTKRAKNPARFYPIRFQTTET